MVSLVIEGFDEYGPPGMDQTAGMAQLAQGGWSAANVYSSAQLVASLNGVAGAAMRVNTASAIPGSHIVRTLAGNYSRLIGGVRFSSNLQSEAGVRFYDNSSVQCMIVVDNLSGFIEVREADLTTILGQSSRSVAAGQEHFLEWDITFGTTGTFTLWLDGVQILTGTGNLQSTAHGYANVIGLSCGSSASGLITFDDLYIFDQTGAADNAVVLTNPAVITNFAVADADKAFDNDGNVVGYPVPQSADFAQGANTLYLCPFTPNVDCTLNSLMVSVYVGSNSGAKLQGVVYADDGTGAPGALLSGGTEVVGFAGGQTITLPITSPQALTNGTQYWFGVLTDSSVSWTTSAPATSFGRTENRTYTSGPPNPAGTMSLTHPTLNIIGLCTGAATNWESIALATPVGDESSVSSSTVGAEDRYTFAALPPGVVAVYSVEVAANCRLTVPGIHTLDLVAKSSVEGNGDNTNIALTLNYAWYKSKFDVDPATSVAWTPTAVNTGTFGMKVAS